MGFHLLTCLSSYLEVVGRPVADILDHNLHILAIVLHLLVVEDAQNFHNPHKEHSQPINFIKKKVISLQVHYYSH